MAAQGERVSEAIVMCNNVLDPMAQDKIPEQDIGMQEQSPPQMDPEPEMGAAAAEAAVYDTSPSLLRNPPPDPCRNGSPKCTRHGPAIRHAGGNKQQNGCAHKNTAG